MTRQSTSGLPYLSLRSDSGKYAYWRTLPDGLAALAKGKVELSWALKPHVLDGKRVIKISLKSGVLSTARRRWGEVHPQIEAMVDTAVAGAKKQSGPVLHPSPTLSSGDRATIAAQARHDVMADHDADWIAAEDSRPLARGLEQALRLRDAGQLPSGEQAKKEQGILLSLADFGELLGAFPPDMTLSQIREAARVKEAASVTQMLASGQTWPLDAPTVVVEEIEFDPNRSSERTVGTYEIASELTSWLTENGYDLSD